MAPMNFCRRFAQICANSNKDIEEGTGISGTYLGEFYKFVKLAVIQNIFLIWNKYIATVAGTVAKNVTKQSVS